MNANLVLFSAIFAAIVAHTQQDQPPHIVVVIADDLGYSDFGFRGSKDISTPNIDAMAYNGVILDKFYTQPSCSPSRTAFLTGKFPIRSGMQGYPVLPGEDVNLPTSVPIMPELLKKFAYKSHLVGKWHLGFSHKNNLPNARGFDSFLGIWNGYCGYRDYKANFALNRTPGFDLHNNSATEYRHNGTYITDLFTSEAVNIIEKHSSREPLFLLYAHTAAHAADGKDDLGVQNITKTNIKYGHLKSLRRRRYADIVSTIDDSIGAIFQSLNKKKMLKNSIILFFSDNGGPTIGTFNNTASNWPLRGTKNTHFEGGIKGSALIYSPLFKKTGYINKQLIHLVDLLPTFYKKAGGNLSDLGTIDGFNQWQAFSEDKPSKRKEFLIDIDDVFNYSSIVSHGGKYKLVNGNFDNEVIGLTVSAHLGETGSNLDLPYNVEDVLNSAANIEHKKLRRTKLNSKTIFKLRNANIKCDQAPKSDKPDIINCRSQTCLFDLENDPCEYKNIASKRPKLVKKLTQKLEKYFAEIVPQVPRFVYGDCADPKWYNNTWVPWLDNENCAKKA